MLIYNQINIRRKIKTISVPLKDFTKTGIKSDRFISIKMLKDLENLAINAQMTYNSLLDKVNTRNLEVDMTNRELKTKQKEIIQQNIEIKSAYEALVESRKKYEQLIGNLKDEYIFFSQAPSGEILFVSPSVKNILHFEISEFRKNKDFIYTSGEVNKGALEHKNASLRGTQQPKYLAEIQDKFENPHVFEITEFPVFNENQVLTAVEGVARDITKEIQSENLMREKEEKYRLLFNNASDFVFFYTIEKGAFPGKFIEVNDYTINMLKYSREELQNMSLNDLAKIEYWEENEKKGDFLGNKKFEQVWATKEGNFINVEIISHNFTLNKKEIGIAIARDITERKQKEEEIRYINEELINQKENLEALVDNLTTAQEQLVHSEKMAALGQLIAGVAHEVNTPLGAIKASIGNLNDSLGKAISELPALVEKLNNEDLKLFTKILESTGYESDNLTSREKRGIRREISKRLENESIESFETISDLIIYLNVQDKIDELIPLLKNDRAEDVLRTARNFASILKNSKTISLAADKAAKVVFALKKYAHRDILEEKVPTDLIDSIETVLTLYHNQLKHGVEVVRNYDTIPLVNCYSDEINQIWTNLIHNSLQAMNQKGTLTLAVKNEGEHVTISVTDNGCGIEPDIKHKIFEPFFTTKKQGEGSGLGLDIVKKIIEKHNGEITFTSELGVGTEFIIKLPIN